MTGHLFIFSHQRITGLIAKDKRIPITDKQGPKALAIKKDALIFLASRNKNNSLQLLMTAKAATGIVSINGTSKYVRLKYAKVRTTETAYEICQGIEEDPNLVEYDYRDLNEQEIAACLFNTQKFSLLIDKARRQIIGDIPTGLNINPDAVFSSAVWSADQKSKGFAFRSWYDSNILSDQRNYASALKYRLQELSGADFERLMQVFFSIQFFGFNVVQTRLTKDNGVDLFLSSKNQIYGDIYLAAQCKRQIAPVGRPAISSFKGAMSHLENVNHNKVKAAKGLFVTTSRFSPEAIEFAKQDGCIHLIDGDELARLFFQYAEQAPGMWAVLNKALPKPIQHNLFQPMKILPKPTRRGKSNDS